MGIIYLLKTREFVNSNIFKIGKSSKPGATRISEYPKGSVLYFLITVTDENTIERKIIDLFSTEFIHKKEYGNEYFEGEYNQIITSMLKIINEVENFSDNKIKPDNDDFKCEYCFCSFFNKQSLTRHYNSCKSQEDPVRQLEIELKINVVAPKCETECRFCNKVFSRMNILNNHVKVCTKRDEYHQNLLNQNKKTVSELKSNNYVCTNCLKAHRDNFSLSRHLSRKIPCVKRNIEQSPISIDNNLINNQNINQIINYYDPPNSIDITNLELNKGISIFNEEKLLYTTGKAICNYRTLLQRRPENRNVHIDPKSSVGQVYDKLTWVFKLKKDIIKDIFKQSAQYLLDCLNLKDVQAPENLVNCLEIIASEGLDISHETLELENFKALSVTENRELVNGVAIILRK